MSSNKNEKQFYRYRAWQWIKHLALADYVPPWANKVGKWESRIYIVDLFAGAGTYNDVVTGAKADGSPVIFARQAQKYERDHPGKELGVICVERNSKNFAALEKRVGGFPHVTTLKGGFRKHLDRICETIKGAPALILFDPIGLASVQADRIRPLLHRPEKTDVFMVLHFKGVHRTGGMLLPTGHADPDKPGAVRAAETTDAVFGSPEWRYIAVNPSLDAQARERQYLDLYFKNVLGDRYGWKCAYPVRATTLSKAQYWLVHAADHPDASWLMNNEIVKLEENLFERSYDREGALPGIGREMFKAEIRAAEKSLRASILKLVAESPGATITFGELRDTLGAEYFGRVKSGAYSNVAKELLAEGLLEREKEGIRPKIDLTEKLSLPPVASEPREAPAA